MDKIKKILAPTDLSELSQAGVRHALEIARSQEAEVIVYHVISYEEANPHDEGFRGEFSSSRGFHLVKWLLQERQRLLAEYLMENFADIIPQCTIRQEVEVGLPYKRIVEKAVEEGVGMIVMSTHGRTGLLHMLIGSVTEKVVRRSTCPVLSIRPTKETKLAEASAG